MTKRLSDEVISARMVELRNLRKLHTHDRHLISELQTENKQLKQLLVDQKAYFEALIETQAARITELETMVFGRTPKNGLPLSHPQTHARQVRPASSYRRPIPPATAITAEEHHSITDCHRCGHALTNKDEAIRYEEDIVVAALDTLVESTTVTKHTIERGWCSTCGQYSSAKDLRGQVVTIGSAVRSLIVYLVMQLDQTYSQVVDLLWQLYHFPLQSGEIAHILAARRINYLPMYTQLKARVRAGPSHMDETRCPIQSEHGAGYAHVMVSAVTEDVVFKLADSRGKGATEKLVGKNYHSVGITDRYGSYKTMFQAGHQICWAHLHRNARDLTRLECLGTTKLKHVTTFYDALATLYATIRQYKAEPFDGVRRQEQADTLLMHIRRLCVPHTLDPKKLVDLKAGILDYQECLFLCLTIDGIPADNNKAERALRKLVIKRKKSFGVKTLKGARTMEVLLSVCQSLYNRDKDNFLVNLHGLATVSQ